METKEIDCFEFMNTPQNERVKGIGRDLAGFYFIGDEGVPYFSQVEDFFRLFLDEGDDMDDEKNDSEIAYVDAKWDMSIVVDIRLSDDRKKAFLTFMDQPNTEYEFTLEEIPPIDTKPENHSAFLSSNIGVVPANKRIDSEVEANFFKLFREKILLLRVAQIMDEVLLNSTLSEPFVKEVSKGFEVKIASYDGAQQYSISLILFGVQVMSIVGDVDMLILTADLNFFDSSKQKAIEELFNICYDELFRLFMEDSSASNLDDVDFGAFEAKILDIMEKNPN